MVEKKLARVPSVTKKKGQPLTQERQTDNGNVSWLQGHDGLKTHREKREKERGRVREMWISAILLALTKMGTEIKTRK